VHEKARKMKRMKVSGSQDPKREGRFEKKSKKGRMPG